MCNLRALLQFLHLKIQKLPIVGNPILHLVGAYHVPWVNWLPKVLRECAVVFPGVACARRPQLQSDVCVGRHRCSSLSTRVRCHCPLSPGSTCRGAWRWCIERCIGRSFCDEGRWARRGDTRNDFVEDPRLPQDDREQLMSMMQSYLPLQVAFLAYQEVPTYPSAVWTLCKMTVACTAQSNRSQAESFLNC